MTSPDASVDETVRLVLLDLGPDVTVTSFVAAVREVHPTFTVAAAATAWERYVGNRDRGRAPTHDVVTGLRR